MARTANKARKKKPAKKAIRKVAANRGRPAKKKVATKKRGRPPLKKTAVKKKARNSTRKVAAKKVSRKVSRNPLITALKAHARALQAVNAIQKKLDKAKEAQKKAIARIEAIKAKEAAKEMKATVKAEKLAAAKVKKAADKEAKCAANKANTQKTPEIEDNSEAAAFDVIEQAEEQSFE